MDMITYHKKTFYVHVNIRGFNLEQILNVFTFIANYFIFKMTQEPNVQEL